MVSTHLWNICNPKCNYEPASDDVSMHPLCFCSIPNNFVVVCPHIQGTAKLTKLF